MSLIILAIALPWALVMFGCWLGYQLVRQNGRILLHLEAMERLLAPEGVALAPTAALERPNEGGTAAPPLPVGSAAPEFELRHLGGERTALSQFRGRRVLLVFFSPRCGYCSRMAPELAALPVDGSDGKPIPLVVTTGEVEENRKLAQEYGLRCPLLLQEQREVAATYRAHGTPVGYLIDEEGKIASGRAVGAEALLALAGAPGPAALDEEESEAQPNGNGRKVYRGNRSLADSKLNRNGLPAGTPAPGFTLPRLDGGALSLEEYRGRQVLLVFSDPHCGPCDQLAPRLERLSRRTPRAQVVMVSRGDVEANRAKVQEHGLTFPVALQRQWEVSRPYGMFGTPIGYLIDEEGIIAADVAIGVEAILTLLSHAAGTNGKIALWQRGKERLPLQR